MTAEEAAEVWGLSVYWVRALCARGKVKAVKVPNPGTVDKWEILQDERPVMAFDRKKPKPKKPLNDLSKLPEAKKRDYIWQSSMRDENIESIQILAQRLGLTTSDVRRMYWEELTRRLHGGKDPLKEEHSHDGVSEMLW